ncbi:MAG: peptidyl-tRNA hydrolase Pth2 [Candidatus Methanomethylophilaceae archaeon]|nr:peptidyl-tRNA hydrolase Pth2 [Candidatus Methanomethylophilaceae archaeon]
MAFGFSSSKVAEESKMVIVMRNDLKMSKGKIAAQAAHAAVNCAFASKKKDPKNFDKWMSEGQKKVVVKVNSEKELFEIKSIADAAGLINSVITDAGRTEIAPGTVTCLGIGPAPESAVDKVTGDLTML